MRYAILPLALVLATPAWAGPRFPCWVNFPDSEPCGAIVTRTDGTCTQQKVDLGWCHPDDLGETVTDIYSYAPASSWPYWQGRWTTLNQVPSWQTKVHDGLNCIRAGGGKDKCCTGLGTGHCERPECLAECQAVAPLWPDYAECCPSGPVAQPPPPPPPALIFADGFESGTTAAWGVTIGGGS